MSEWKNGWVRVALRAEVSGVFAIHAEIEGSGRLTLTHRPTGYAVARDQDEEKLKAFATKIGKHPGWKQLKKKDGTWVVPPALKNRAVKLKKELGL